MAFRVYIKWCMRRLTKIKLDVIPIYLRVLETKKV